MGENFKFNHGIFLTAFVAFLLTSLIIILCVLLLAKDDDEECGSIVYANDEISANSDIYTCDSNPCRNNGRCFTTKVKENCTCPVGYLGWICNDPAFIKVKLHSQNVCDSHISCPHSSIMINGSLINVTDPGLTFVIVNATTGKQVELRRFEIRPGQTTWNNITHFLTYLPSEMIILMVFAQNGSSNHILQTIPILALALNNQIPENMSRVSSWVLAGYKGVLGVSWTTSIKSTPDMGSANVTLSIPIVGVGQDCKQCEPTSCLKVINGFTCECAPGYIGTTCTQKLIEKCSGDQVQCYNGAGRCVYSSCHSCPSGYNGAFCAEPKKMNVSLLAQSPIGSSSVNNSSITVNGTIYSNISLGITFVVINASSGQLYAQQHFKSDIDNNYTSYHSAITSFVNGLPQEVYILSVMKRAGRKCFNSLVKLILKEQHLEDIVLPANNTKVYSWALVVYNGVFNISRPIIFVRTSLNRSAVIDTSITITGLGLSLDGICSNNRYKCHCGPEHATITCAETLLKPYET